MQISNTILTLHIENQMDEKIQMQGWSVPDNSHKEWIYMLYRKRWWNKTKHLNNWYPDSQVIYITEIPGFCVICLIFSVFEMTCFEYHHSVEQKCSAGKEFIKSSTTAQVRFIIWGSAGEKGSLWDEEFQTLFLKTELYYMSWWCPYEELLTYNLYC